MAKQDYIFPEMHRARYGAGRQQRLMLPRLLSNAGNRDANLPRPSRDRAQEIICRWADLENSGKLEEMNETTLEGEFLSEVFGDALGYTLFSENLDLWNIQPKYSINGGQADAALGIFRSGQKIPPRAVIELKGPTTDLDRDRVNGRTAVQQCWDYLYNLPECSWGIVCNYVSFRLYHRNQKQQKYELFTLKDLTNPDNLRQFYYLFEKGGLLPSSLTTKQAARADLLLEETNNRQLEVGDSLYEEYKHNREDLIGCLRKDFNKPLDVALRIAQKLLDRVIFIAFCEDRNLIPEKTLYRAWDELPPFRRVVNPRWQNFRDLFFSIDKGNELIKIPPFNGGLFRKDPEVDELELDDDHTDFFKKIGDYDFRDEVNVDVLGHLFERSVHDIERIRTTGFFQAEEPGKQARMDKSAERKRGGIYYTPPEFTRLICEKTIGEVVRERVAIIAQGYGVDPAEASKSQRDLSGYCRDCITAIRRIKVVDPACGSGAFLIQAYNELEHHYLDIVDVLAVREPKAAESLREEIGGYILHDNLYGVDLSEEAVEISQLALWLRSARKGKTLADLSHNIVHGNSLVSDSQVDALAIDWRARFTEIFERAEGGFDCVIGNPPWERMKLQEREFFDSCSPEIAAAVNAATRRKLIERLQKDRPELHQRYEAAKAKAESGLDYIRTCQRYPMTGTGDINTYALFAELAFNLVGPKGRVGILVPSGISTDHTTRHFFGKLVESKALYGLYDFENRNKIFPDVDGRFKFSVFLFGGKDTQFESVDFAFFLHAMEELEDKKRHIELAAEDIRLLNPNTGTCPIFRSRRDAEITKGIYRRVPVLVDQKRTEGGNPWGVKFIRMFDQTNDAELFHTAEQLKDMGLKRHGAIWRKGKQIFLPLYEAKMVQGYDHRAASVVVEESNWMRQGQTSETSLVQHQNPEYVVEPRWWVDQEKVVETLGATYPGFLGFKDITSPTNQRTMIASAIPWTAATNHLPLILSDQSIRLQLCLLGNLNSFAFDYVARQKIGGITLNFFIVEQLPVFSPDFYGEVCPWSRRVKLEKWISDRVLKLSCTSDDLRPLAEAAGFEKGVHKWNENERMQLTAELDAAYFVLYGIEREDVEYILTTFSATADEVGAMFGQGTAKRILECYDTLRGTKE